jgi:hypothetical protein
MKRSKKINLILVTAALASCNRSISPTKTFDYDWVYGTRDNFIAIANDSNYYHRYGLPWEYYNYWYYAGNSTRINGIKLTMKGSVTRKKNFVFRGGWGSHGFASS